jgi:hypothetical protein
MDATSYSLAPPDSLQLSINAQGATNFVSGFNSSTSISFGFNATAVGTFPLVSLYLNNSGTTAITYVPNSANVTVTEYGTLAGTYTAGSFNAIVYDGSGVNHPVQCSFRLRR